MKTLVTGGAGFIGSNICKLLLDEGHEVRVIDNLSSGYKSNVDALPDVEFVEGDIRDADAVDRVVDGVEVVFHCAASVGNKRGIDFPIDDTMINAVGTLHILEAMRRHGSRKIVTASSAGIFGELKTLPIKEDHPIEPISPYGVSKLATEKHCLAYASLYELEAVALRYFNVFGVNQRFDAYGNVIPIFAHRIYNGETITIFGDGEQTRDFINVRDVAQANYKAAMKVGVSGAFNMGSATQVTINYLADIMKKISGREVEIVHGPERAGDVRDSLADVSAATAAFGFEPQVSLEAGLEEYMPWAEQEMGGAK